MKRWYGAHSTELYVPPALEHLRGRASLAAGEAGALLGPYQSSMPSWPAASPGAAGVPQPRAMPGISFAQVEAHLLALLPSRMRDAGGPASRPLLVVVAGTFGGMGRPRCPCMFEMVERRHVAGALAGPLFRRLGLDMGDWAYSGRTHPFRHLLVTTALRGGLSEAEVAEWCGHASTREVRDYDHRTAAEMRAIVGRASKVGRRSQSPLAPEQRQDPDDAGSALP